MTFPFSKGLTRAPILGTLVSLLLTLLTCTSRAQGPAPETAPPIFPKGAFVSYSSSFTTRGFNSQSGGGISPTARPTFMHEGDFHFTWGFHPDFDLSILVPLITNHFLGPSTQIAGTDLGDLAVEVKYRFYRRDSDRGTNQASVTLGPKFPTGRTGLVDASGNALPAGLQPGSGSTDFLLGANWTYTGVFRIKRLVADEDFHAVIRSEGTQATRLGSDIASRFWLSYRPYEAANGQREWFIGPVITWLHSQDDRIAGVTQVRSGGDALLVGITTYAGIRPGTHVFLGMDWDVAHSMGGTFMPIRRHIGFGITQQFRIP